MFEKYRKKVGLTQEQVAEKTNISWRQLQRIEKGVSIPTLETLAKLAKVLKISDKDLINYIYHFLEQKEYVNAK